MSEAFQERRRPRSFRILYMPLDSFIRRFIRMEEAPSVVAGPDTSATPAPRQGGDSLAAWKCGVTRIDEPNEALFKAIRQYQAAFKAGAGAGATEEILAFVVGHVDHHLPFEEAFLDHLHFPDLVEHRRRHQVFQHQIHAIQDRMAKGDPSAGLELSQMLYAWMKEHILKEDVLWCTYAKSKRRPVSTTA